MVPAAAGEGGFRASRPWTQLPEPERFWICYAPRTWSAGPGPDGPLWLDLARGQLGAPGHPGTLGDVDAAAERPGPLLPAGPFDDVLYVPPVAPEAAGARAERDRAVAGIVAEGTPVLVHLFPGDPPPPAGATGVVDLLDALVERRLDELAAVPDGAAAAVWPLLAGLTDGEDLLEEGLARLAAAGLRTVQPVAPDLPPPDRRRLAEGRDERVFDALFHGRPRDPRLFSRRARGLWRLADEEGSALWDRVVFTPRPLPRPPLAGSSQREVAGLLLVAGELELRLGHHGRGQAHFRAARWIDRTQYDLKGLAAEGNLAIIPWLDPASRQLVEEWARTGRSATVEGTAAEYLSETGSSVETDGLSADR